MVQGDLFGHRSKKYPGLPTLPLEKRRKHITPKAPFLSSISRCLAGIRRSLDDKMTDEI